MVNIVIPVTAQKMKFSIKDFSSKYDQIRSLLRIWSHLLKKFLMENLIFCAVCLCFREAERYESSDRPNNTLSLIGPLMQLQSAEYLR